MKKKLLISFSGGRTSAYMCWWLLNEWKDRDSWEMVIVFANTGKEKEGTLFFVDECAQEWGIDIVWVEGYPSDKGKGWAVIHKVVNYETASRKGEPFEAMISRLGIPSTEAPFCSEQLKKKAIESYLKSIGWDDYYKALGIRWDERQKRLNKNWRKLKIIYPFIHYYKVSKLMVKWFWDAQSFDLDINPDEGNCDNCWKKDMPRLVRNMVRNPDSFDWWQRMTDEYGHMNPRNVDLEPPFNFYRGNMSPIDIRELANKSQEEIKQLFLFEQFDSCSTSCEAF